MSCERRWRWCCFRPIASDQALGKLTLNVLATPALIFPCNLLVEDEANAAWFFGLLLYGDQQDTELRRVLVWHGSCRRWIG